MKKLLCILLAMTMMFGMAACGEDETENSGETNTTEEAASGENNKGENQDDEVTGSVDGDEQSDEDAENADEEDAKEETEDKNEKEDGEEKEDSASKDVTKNPNAPQPTAKPGEHLSSELVKYQGIITENDSSHEYPFRLKDSGMISLKHKGKNIEYTKLKIHDSDGREVWQDSPYWNSTSKQISYSKEIELIAGDYVLYVEKYRGTGNFEIEVKHTTAGESFAENADRSDNAFDEANEIKTGDTIYGQLACNDNIDTFKFTLAESGANDLSVKAENIEYLKLKLYDADGQEIWSEAPYWNSTSKFISFSKTINLTAGTYYFTVSEYRGNGDYQFVFKYTSAKETFAEGNDKSDNEFAKANAINVNQKYVGHLAINDKIDNYTFKVAADSGCGVSLNAQNIEYMTVKIYNEDGKEIWGKSPYWNSTTKKLTYKETVNLSKGTYYISFSEYRGLGVYDFTIAN